MLNTSAKGYRLFPAILLLCPFMVRGAVTDCIENGGAAICIKPALTEWQYALCDEAGPSTGRGAVSCEVWQEGTPSGTNCINTNANALNENNLVDKAKEFRSFPTDDVPYGAFGPNSNSFAYDLVTRTLQFPTVLPPEAPGSFGAPVIGMSHPKFP
jgi:hypothetical protein